MAAVEARAAVTGLTPAPAAAATTSGTSTLDRAERDWRTRWAAVLTPVTTARKTHGGTSSGTPPTSQRAAPESASAMPIAIVAAMKSSSDQGTVRSASFIRTVPSAGEAATTAPISATTAGGTRCRGSLHQSTTTVESSRAQRASAGERGPVTGESLCSWMSSAPIRTGPSRSARRVVVSRTASAARWEEAMARGRPSSSHSVKPIRSPVASQSTETVMRWAPRRSAWPPPTAG